MKFRIGPDRVRRNPALLGGVLLSLCVAACGQAPTASPSARLLDDRSDGADWPSYGRTNGQQHYSPLAQLNRGNIARLSLAWSLDYAPGGNMSQPIAVDGVIYFTSSYSIVHAVDAVTGKLLWQYDPQARTAANRRAGGGWAGWGARGIGWWNGKIFAVTKYGDVIALDARTGKPLWTTPTEERDDVSYVTGAPHIFNGVLVIGNAGDNGKVRGRVVGIDAETGKELWRFHVVPGDPAKGFASDAEAMAAKTWSGDWWKFGGNGTPWNAFSFDPETGLVYIGTGNGYPYNHRFRSEGKGDNLFLSSIVALDLKTGAYKWHYQAAPADTWDWTMVHDLQLADLEIGGKPRKVLLTAAKNGFFYVLDRVTGELLSAEPFTKVTWATKVDLKTGRPVEAPNARYENGTFVGWPSSWGAHNVQPMAYDPGTKLTYIPIVQMGGSWTDASRGAVWNPPQQVPSGMVPSFGIENTGDPRENTAALIAWDPVRQKEVWRVQAPRMIPVGVAATAGGLVFQGAIDGTFNAYDALTGKRLWSFDTGAPVLSPPVTFSAHGKQYVSVLTGVGNTAASWGRMYQSYRYDYRTTPKRLLIFALDGKAVLPPRQAADWSKPADPDYRPDPAAAQAGAITYIGNCAACHGFAAVSGGAAPDLRRSGVPLSEEAFAQVVHEGLLEENGMPRFSMLTARQLAELRQYIRAQAHDPLMDKETKTPGMALR